MGSNDVLALHRYDIQGWNTIGKPNKSHVGPPALVNFSPAGGNIINALSIRIPMKKNTYVVPIRSRVAQIETIASKVAASPILRP